jgi:uncharacterized protein YjbI with pentapeptide repeats
MTPAEQSLRGRDLRGEDLSGADLRGKDLSRADLRDSDLRRVKTGLGTRAAVGLSLVAAAIAAVGGVTSSWLGHMIEQAVRSPDGAMQMAGVVLLSELLLCLSAMVWRGTFYVLARILPPTLALILLSTVAHVVVQRSSRGLGPVVLAIVALFVVVLLAVTLARAIAAGVGVPAMLAVVVAWLLGARAASGHVAALLTAAATVVAGMRAAAGSATSPRLSRWAPRIAALGGTSFHGADLRGARVADASFRCTDLRGARFDGVDWNSAREVDFCVFDDVAGAPARHKKHAGAMGQDDGRAPVSRLTRSWQRAKRPT